MTVTSTINRFILKLTHIMLTLAIWATGLIKTIFGTIFSGVMGAMLKGSQISDIHNFTAQTLPKHAAIIASEDWVDKIGDSTAAELYLIQILAWVMLSGITMVTVYDQAGKLSLHSVDLEKKLMRYLSETAGKSVDKSMNNFSVFIEQNGDQLYPNMLSSAIGAPLNGMKTYARVDHVMKEGYNPSYQEPSVVLVLDPKNKKQLCGFNPWAIRLSEFSFLNKLYPTQTEIQTTLQKYTKIEKRFGK